MNENYTNGYGRPAPADSEAANSLNQKYVDEINRAVELSWMQRNKKLLEIVAKIQKEHSKAKD